MSEMTTNTDKGVCTNDVLEDLHRAIKFEAVFSTLIENKILSIKRECEERRKEKRTRSSLSRFLFGRRRNVASIVVDSNLEAFPADNPNDVGVICDDRDQERPRLSVATTDGQWCTLVQEDERGRQFESPTSKATTIGYQNGRRGNVDEVPEIGMVRSHLETTSLDRNTFANEIKREGPSTFEYKYDAISIQSDKCRRPVAENLSYEAKCTERHHRPQSMVAVSGSVSSGVVVSPQQQCSNKRSQSDDFIARSKHSGQIKCSRPNEQTSGTAFPQGMPARKPVVVGTDTDIFVRDRLSNSDNPPSGSGRTKAPRPTKSILTSSSSSLQSTPCSSSITNATNCFQIGPNDSPSGKVSHSAAAVIDTGPPPVKLCPREASELLAQERNRLRIFELRSVSAQCSPILPRHIEFDGLVNLSNSAPIPLHSANDDDNNQTTGDNLNGRGQLDATPVKSHRRHNHKSKSQRAAEYLASQIDFDSLASYPQVNPKTQGIISSFNQLKSPNLPRVIPMKQQQQQHPQKNSADVLLSKVKKGAAGDTSTCGESSHSTVATTCCAGTRTSSPSSGRNQKCARPANDRSRVKDRDRDEDNNESIRQSSEY